MYSLNLPVSQLRTKVRQEFERHRYVNKLPVVDMLLFQSYSEFQVYPVATRRTRSGRLSNWIISAGRMLTERMTGNTEFLEADTTCDEVLSGNRESDSKIACRFHAGLSGGRHCVYSSGVRDG